MNTTKDCGCSDYSETTFKKSIAKKAAVLVASLPDELACRKMEDQKKAKFLSAVRNFAAECTLANHWDSVELKAYNSALELFEATTDYIAQATDQSKCGEAKRSCVRRCDIDDGGYFCYFDCRLEYMVCLADSVLSRD